MVITSAAMSAGPLRNSKHAIDAVTSARFFLHESKSWRSGWLNRHYRHRWSADRKIRMANPNPQHTPTDGLGVAAYVQLSGSSGSSVIESNGAAFPGQGTGAVPSGTRPVAQYGLTLSVSSAGGYVNSLAVLADLVDAQNNVYVPSDLDQFTAISYNNPSAGSPAWYNPSNFAGYSADVASVAVAGI